MSNDSITRRGFVGAVAATTAASTLTASARASASPAADKVRFAIIGAGSRGNQLLDVYLKRDDCEFLYVIDVDDKHANDTAERIGKAQGKKPETARDYRKALDDKNVDAVVIATPDHWHALPTIHACMAGKDVYCEKPLAHNVAEGQAMVKAARKFKRVVAVGTQQRSSENFQKAVEAVRSGKLGKVFWVQTWNFENISPVGMGRYPDSNPPEGLDYDRWLGPAPQHAYNPNRCHLLFRWFFDYAGGMMSDWGVHLNDIVLWALDQKGPKAVSAAGGIFTTDDDRDTPDTLADRLRLPRHDPDLLDAQGERAAVQRPQVRHPVLRHRGLADARPLGVRDHARHGRPALRHQAGPRRPRGAQDHAGEVRRSRPRTTAPRIHIDNFFKCLKSRERPTTDVEIGHRSTITTHLGNIAYKLGRKLQWDAETETFPHDADANALLARIPRKGYELPEI